MTPFQTSMVAMSVAREYSVLLFLWLLMLPAIFLLRGKRAHELMIRVSVYIFALVVGTRMCAIWLFLTMTPSSFEWAYMHGVVQEDVIRLLVPIVCLFAALAGHAFIYAIAAMRENWTTTRNKIAVGLYAGILLLGLYHPVPFARFFHQWFTSGAQLKAATLEQVNRQTDEMTAQWLEAQPDDWATLLIRANSIEALGRNDEATPLRQQALDLMPDEYQTAKESLRQKIEAAEKKR